MKYRHEIDTVGVGRGVGGWEGGGGWIESVGVSVDGKLYAKKTGANNTHTQKMKQKNRSKLK